MSIKINLRSVKQKLSGFKSEPISDEGVMGTYTPGTFILRLHNSVHTDLLKVPAGVSKGELTAEGREAFSIYLHETIHWWQHIGSNFGLIAALQFPAQSHFLHHHLRDLLKEVGAYKSLAQLNQQFPKHDLINRILNTWNDIEFAGEIAFDHENILDISKNPYFESWAHSYHLLWSSVITTLAATVDREFNFLPDVREWPVKFRKMREQKEQHFYYQSPNKITPIGTFAIFEGQAMFTQLQYLHQTSAGQLDISDFIEEGLLWDIYRKAFDVFLEILNEPMPDTITNSIVGLFLLVCDVALNPTDGFPFDLEYLPAFIYTTDPGHRFILITQMIRDKQPDLKMAVQNYSKEEYIEVSKKLASSISCLSPHDSSLFIWHWIQEHQSLKDLLQQEADYKFAGGNLPIRLIFAKYLRFQLDKIEYPHFFCWSGMYCTGDSPTVFDLNEGYKLFEKHKAVFIDNVDGSIYHSEIKDHREPLVDEILTDFFSWNSVYDMVRQWVSEPGEFRYNYNWITHRYSSQEIKEWIDRNFHASYGVHPSEFKIL